MSGVSIIEMHEHHIDGVVALEQATSATAWSASVFLSEMANPTYELLVARIDDEQRHEKVCGFTGGQVVGNEFHIHSLAVEESMRRQGIGERLIRELLQIALGRDAKSATLEVRVSNDKAISLYEKVGFIHEGIRPKYYADNGEDAAIMWLHSIKVPQ